MRLLHRYPDETARDTRDEKLRRPIPEETPFLAAIGLFMLGYLGLAISTFPYLVPPVLTIWDTAAAPASQAFMLIGTAVLLPLILLYTGFVYWVFRGKVSAGQGYH